MASVYFGGGRGDQYRGSRSRSVPVDDTDRGKVMLTKYVILLTGSLVVVSWVVDLIRAIGAN